MFEAAERKVIKATPTVAVVQFVKNALTLSPVHSKIFIALFCVKHDLYSS